MRWFATAVAFLLTFAGFDVVGAQQPSPVRLRSVVLHDIQGLFGGQSLWIDRDGTGFVQVVANPPGGGGAWERRYHAKLTSDQFAEVERLVSVHRLLTAAIPNRAGRPDEARPTLILTSETGVAVTLAKWAGDTHAGFDALYAYLVGLSQQAGDLIREGRYESDWRPEGFN